MGRKKQFTPEELRERRRSRERERYQQPEVREKILQHQQSPEYLERRREYDRKRRQSPEYRAYRRSLYRDNAEWRERTLADRRQWHQEKRAAELAYLGDPTACGVCGGDLTPIEGKPDPRRIDHRHDNDLIRGVVCNRCNAALGVIDLRYTNPELWNALLTWSAKGEPTTKPARSKGKRRHAEPHPALFSEKK